jgi:hypothetical protein
MAMKKTMNKLDDVDSRKRSHNRVIQAGIEAAKKAGMDEESIQLLKSMKRKVK